jgi:hypothetical protein
MKKNPQKKIQLQRACAREFDLDACFFPFQKQKQKGRK